MIFPYITVVKCFILNIDLNFSSNMKLNDLDGYNPRVLTLQNKWRTVWRMSIDRKKALQDALDTLQEVRMYCLFIPVQMPLPEFILWNTLIIFSIFQLEGLKTFDFEVWKTKYLNWIKAKKLRITDFFRRQDKDGDGFLSREEFVNGMLHTRKCQKIDEKLKPDYIWPVMQVVLLLTIFYLLFQISQQIRQNFMLSLTCLPQLTDIL